MESIKDRVAIIGMGCTKFGELWDKGPYDLIVDACHEAFEDAGIESKDIQAAWFASLVSAFTGSRLSNALKLEYVPITRVENFCSGGLHALANACYAVASGVCDIALACGVEKLKDRASGFAMMNPEPIDSSKVIPETPPANMFAHIAIRYFHDRGWDVEEGKRILAQVSVKSHHNGTLNPKAHLRREITVDDVLNAPMLINPLGLYDCCGISDGCAAAVVVRADMAGDFRDDYVLLKGFGLACGDEYAQISADYDWTHWKENLGASKMAYEEAGITDPRQQIQVAELHDCFTINELVTYEDLGFSSRGKAIEDVNAGFFELDGGLPINTDGGLKSFGHPVGASGLRMVYEIYLQLKGQAGSRQINNANLGLTHNIGGWPGAFTSAIAIFGRRK